MLDFYISMLPIFYNIKKSFFELFSWQNLVLQIVTYLVTYLIVISGFDWNYFIFVQTHSFTEYLSPAIGIGGLVPIFGLPVLYFFAKIRKQEKLLVITWALAQAAAFGWLVSSLYKAFTGRVQPPHGLVTTLIDTSRDWNFGFLQHGIFWGWPSSHTTVAFAMSFTLVTLFPKRKDILTYSLLYALYIGLGVSVQIHWFSEFAAGAIIGSLIGLIVGKSFYTKLVKIA